MPLYDFACEECGTRFERLVRHETAIATVDCPQCGAANAKRELSLPAAPLSISSMVPSASACGSGPPCGASWCQRKAN
jgi:putative FmdB family regulatory protein